MPAENVLVAVAVEVAPRSAWTGYFLRLGALGFGGPIALSAAMQRDLVEERRWVTPDEYKEGLALAQLAPGPLAAQLAIYLGWLRGACSGRRSSGVAFVGPSFLMVLLLAWLYLRFGGLPWMQGGVLRHRGGGHRDHRPGRDQARRAHRRPRPPARVGLAVSAVVAAWTERELVWVFALSGLAGTRCSAWLARRSRPGPWRRSSCRGPGGHRAAWRGRRGDAGPGIHLLRQGGAVVFGSGLAIVPFLHGGVVSRFGWLTERQFLDAVAVSMITPGPVVITVAFIGYLVAGPLGGLVAALGMFLPTYLAVVLVAPWFRRVMTNRALRSAVDGVTAAAAGAIAGAVVVLGRRALIDGPTWGIAFLTLVLLWRVRRIPEPALILGAGLVGVLLPR